MRKSHRNVYEEHLDYLKTYVQKTYKYLMIEYTEGMKNLFKYNKYLQPPIMHSQSSLEADQDKHNEFVPEKVIIKAIRDELNKTMQEKSSLKTNNIVWCPMRCPTIILTPSTTTRCIGGIPRKELETSSSIHPYPMTTQMPPAEEYPRRQGKRSRKTHKVKQDSYPFARDLGLCTPSTPPNITAPETMRITQIRKSAAASLTVTLSPKSSRNRKNTE